MIALAGGVWLLATGVLSSFYNIPALNRSIGAVMAVISICLVALHAVWMFRAGSGEDALSADPQGVVSRVSGLTRGTATADEILGFSAVTGRVIVSRSSRRRLSIPTSPLAGDMSEAQIAVALQDAVSGF